MAAGGEHFAVAALSVTARSASEGAVGAGSAEYGHVPSATQVNGGQAGGAVAATGTARRSNVVPRQEDIHDAAESRRTGEAQSVREQGHGQGGGELYFSFESHSRLLFSAVNI